MAKKKISIGELIKGDMSRRSIGDSATEDASWDSPPEESSKHVEEAVEKAKPVPVKKSVAQTDEKKPPVARTALPVAADATPNGNAEFEAFIRGQVVSVGLTGEADLRNFYSFLQSQAMRYIRGFDAGRRFHG